MSTDFNARTFTSGIRNGLNHITRLLANGKPLTDKLRQELVDIKERIESVLRPEESAEEKPNDTSGVRTRDNQEK